MRFNIKKIIKLYLINLFFQQNKYYQKKDYNFSLIFYAIS